MDIKQLTQEIKAGYKISREEAKNLIEENLEPLLEAANEIRLHFNTNQFDLCSIINGKSGKCSENCTYCAQSAHYKTCIEEYPLMDQEEIIKDALYHEVRGVYRYSIVTSGKKLAFEDVEEICEIYKKIGEVSHLKLCASHGLLTREELRMLKEAGVKRYHNNLESSRDYFNKLCTTHTYDEKIETIKNAKAEGLEVCCGGIFGVGETMLDRIDMAFEIKELDIDSIPLNILNPIKGTPLESAEPISEEEFLKSVAIFKLINPTKVIRLAGGRNFLTGYGEKAFRSGVSGTITGDLLTTCGNNIEADKALVTALGYKL